MLKKKSNSKKVDNYSAIIDAYNNVTISAYGDAATMRTGASTWDFTPPAYPSSVKTPETFRTQEEISDYKETVASSIENLIQDLLPDCEDKNLSVTIAKAVVDQLWSGVHSDVLLDPVLISKAEETVTDRLRNMTIEEYAKERNKLLGLSANPSTTAIPTIGVFSFPTQGGTSVTI